MTPKTRRVKITVTKKDIQMGLPSDSCLCPIARAVRRVLGRGVRVWRYGVYRRLSEDDFAEFPERVTQFIDRFDDGKPVKPFTFTLRIPA